LSCPAARRARGVFLGGRGAVLGPADGEERLQGGGIGALLELVEHRERLGISNLLGLDEIPIGRVAQRLERQISKRTVRDDRDRLGRLEQVVNRLDEKGM
jgi:hypothetical protein